MPLKWRRPSASASNRRENSRAARATRIRFESRLARQAQPADAVLVHRGVTGGEIEATPVELGKVGDEIDLGVPFAHEVGGETELEGLIGEMQPRIAAHRRDSAGAGLARALSSYHGWFGRSPVRL